MDDIRSILFPVWCFVLLFLMMFLLLSISSRIKRKKLANMLDRIYHGDLAATEDFHFLDTRPEQLYFPFTEKELRSLASCREIMRNDVTVELMHPAQAIWENFYYHVACCFEGVDRRGESISIQREGYLYIACSEVRGHWGFCITSVQTREKPFVL